VIMKSFYEGIAMSRLVDILTHSKGNKDNEVLAGSNQVADFRTRGIYEPYRIFVYCIQYMVSLSGILAFLHGKVNIFFEGSFT